MATWRESFGVEGMLPQQRLANAYDTYQTAPEQSFSAVMKVLLRKHFVLGWRRRRILGVMSRTLVSALIPSAIWFLQPASTVEHTRPILALVACPLLGTIFVVSVFIQFVIEIVTDKELKMRFVQQVAGVSNAKYWCSYYVFYGVITSFATVFYLVLVMKIAPIYQYSNCVLMFLLYTFGFLEAFFICIIVSTVLSNARMAAVVCALLSSLVVGVSQIILPQISTENPFIYFIESLIPFVTPLNLLNAVGVLEGDPYSCGFTTTCFYTDINIRNPQSRRQQLQPSAGVQFWILLIDCFVYGLFALWFDQVYQGEFGAAKPWNFCTRSEYFRWRRPRLDSLEMARSPALAISNLVKAFSNGHRAVDGMSLVVARREIFALLGHNGAGKTTAINCITGMLPMTSGAIRVCGVDVETQLQEARRYMSICPQDNPLYPEFTVYDHLSFFAALRGVPSERAEADIGTTLAALGLEEKRHTRVQTLSGGQKRRLWVATSLLGSTPMVFLDEPTSGMDPANRRLLWDLLIDMKNRGRCILFTTHYLDEADVLAERKAVLDNGKVCAIGTSWDLKKQFGLGYHLRVVCAPTVPDSTQAVVGSLIRSHIQSAIDKVIPEEERSRAPEAKKQWSFTLPYVELPNFGTMLRDLENRAGELGIADFGLETTSLEEVFMSLGQGQASGRVSDDLQVPALAPSGVNLSEPCQISHPATGLPVHVRFPVGAVAGHLYQVSVPREAVTLNLASSSLRVPVTWSTSMLAVFRLRLKQAVQNKRALAPTLVVPGALLFFSAWGQARALRNAQMGSSGIFEKQELGLAGAGAGMNLSISLAIALPYFATTLVVDRTQRCTYVATSQGLPYSAYWVGTFLNNYTHFLMLALLIPICFLVFHIPFYGEEAQISKILLASLCAPIPMLLFAYSFSRVFSSAENCSKFMPAVCLMASVIPFMAVYIMTILSVTLQLTPQGDIRAGLKMHSWATAVHVGMCFCNPFYCLPGTFAALGLTVFNELPIGLFPVGAKLGFPQIFGSSVALPLVGALSLSLVLSGTLIVDLNRLKKCVGPILRRRYLLRVAARDVEVGDAMLSYVLDADVQSEDQRVSQLNPSGQAVMYKNLVHTYNKGRLNEVRAVRGISLAVGTGECFSLLGPNGAGKTTTLDVLTGAIFPPTAGEVYVNGHCVTGTAGAQRAALQGLGNCPQVDPLWPTLSGRQHLIFYGRIKGLPIAAQSEQASALLSALGFSDFDADKPTQGYSGGMKRKLSLAIALIGSPPTLLLDEPSAAVDAAAKRHLWRVVRQREQGQTVILTTHSMEEAEALSDRLAIQVKGRLRCVGTPDHIKNVHGAGYQLEILFDRNGSQTSGSTAHGHQSFTNTAPCPEVIKYVESVSKNAKLLEYHEGRYLFQLPVLKAVGAGEGEASLSSLFSSMQEGYQAIGLRDYSVSRPSLEQVFIKFSKEQEEIDERDA